MLPSTRLARLLWLTAGVCASAGADAQQTPADLSLSIQGPAIEYVVVGRNLGAVSTDRLTLIFTPPVSLFILAWEPDPGAQCAVIFTVPMQLECTWAESTPAGASRQLRVTSFSGSVSSVLVARARVYTGADSNPFGPAAATAVLTTTAADTADLELGLSPSNGNPTRGMPATLSLSATNHGGNHANDMRLTLSTRDRLDPLNAQAAGADCVRTDEANSVSCLWRGQTAPGLTRTMQVEYVPRSDLVRFDALAGSETPDFEFSNNQGQLQLAVNPAPVPSLSPVSASLLALMILITGWRRWQP